MDEFDLDLADVTEVNEVYKVDPRTQDRRICICGHAMSRHHYNHPGNRHYCKPGQLSCPCIAPRPVIDVPNTRYFMRKSLGSGKLHALARGVAASIEALGEDFTDNKKWLVEELCDLCGQEAKFYPVQVTTEGVPLGLDVEDMGVTAFMCSDCRAKF